MDDEARRRFGEFVAVRTPELIRLAYLLTGSQHAAEDLLQSALARTVARWSDLRDINPEAYLRKVMYHEQVSLWRRLRRWREFAARQPAEVACADPSGQADLRLAMRDALLRLPPAQRLVLVLRYYEDLSESQVAEALGCSVGTVRSRTHRAVAKLRRLAPELAALRDGVEVTP